MSKNPFILDGDIAYSFDRDGTQVRVFLRNVEWGCEPERGYGMWNEGVSLVVDRTRNVNDLDEHDGVDEIWARRTYCQDCREYVISREHEALPYFGSNSGCDWHWKGDSKALAIRYLKVFYGVNWADILHHAGSAPSNWADVWVIAEGEATETIARETFREWSAWASGEVYEVVAHYRTPMDDNWEESDNTAILYGYENRENLLYAVSDAMSGAVCGTDIDMGTFPHGYEVAYCGL